ncbi:MAG: cytochrome d ubiquinol oxidase subunit II [Candidatus Micrarchaeales archaeon]
MNIPYTINYLIFSAFLTLLIFEIGVAILSLAFYKDYKARLRKYLLPIWEVMGTFAAFYLINFEVTYPTLLPFAGTVYILPVLVAGAFFLLRGAFIAFTEYLNRPESDGRYIKIYSISTLMVAFLALSVLDSGVSGIGISLANTSINLVSLLFNPFNILMFAGVVLISMFVVSNYFEVYKLNKLGILYAAVGIVLVLFSLYQYAPSIFSNILSNLYLLAISIILLLITIVAYLKKSKYANYLVVFWLFLSINLFGVVQYPYFFGGQNITAYLAASAISGAEIAITIIGGMFVVVALGYLIYLNYIRAQEEAY